MLAEQFRWREAISSLLPCMQSISDEEKGCLVLCHARRAIQMMSLVRPNLDRHTRPRKKKRKRFLLKENPESRSVGHRRCKNGREREGERGAISSPQNYETRSIRYRSREVRGKKKQRIRRRRTMPCVCPALRFGNLMSGIRLKMPEGFDIAAAAPPPPTTTTVITTVSGKHDILIEQSDSADLLRLIRGLIGRNGAWTTTQLTLGVEDCRMLPSSSLLPPILLSRFACVRRNCADRGTVIFVCRSWSSWLCNSLISVRSKD
jgi:hypothetical protein